MRRLILVLSLLTATGCSHAPLPHAIGLQSGISALALARQVKAGKVGVRAERPTDPVAPTGNTAQSAALDALLHSLFRDNFNALDIDHDGLLTNLDFEVSDASFRRVLGGFDGHKDGKLTFEEYYSPARAKDMLMGVQDRAAVSALGVGGHVTLDKAQFMFDVYLQDRITNAGERARAIQDAFTIADADHTGVLAKSELEIALAILEARADLRHLEHLLHLADPGVVADPVASSPISL